MQSVAVVEGVVVHEENEEAFLLHVASGRYFGLNRSGVVVWNALADGSDPVERLQAAWPERAHGALVADAEALIARLLEAGLVRAA